jgi:hypothetical protein
MVAILPKCGIGSFTNHQNTVDAITALESSKISSSSISVVNQSLSQENRMAISEEKYIQSKTIQGIKKGVILLGSLGATFGFLIGIGALKFLETPGYVAGIKSALIGSLAGGFYGIVPGCILGAMVGNGIARQQAKLYATPLSAGNDLIIIEGSKEELLEASSVLKNFNVENWNIYQST